MSFANRKIAEGILFTDEYQLTMAQLYFRMGLHEQTVQFDHFFRTYPNYGNSYQAGYCVNAGLEWLLEWMQEARFRQEDLDSLRVQTGRTGQPLYGQDFLDWLSLNGSFDSLTLRAIPEGRVVHPQLPLTTVQGPIAMAQILESALLNHLNYQTLIATKAARIHDSAEGRTLLEFGMRRAQGYGANAGTRAALIGGADFSSNVGISHLLGLSPKGTHAHSMVQLFKALGQDELGAFRAFAEVYPDDCLLLVDTVNTLESGVPNAIKVFEELRKKGHTPVGIRIDSGDLAYLAIQAVKLLDSAGFSETSIILSNELDEIVIWQIQTQILSEAAKYGVDPHQMLKRLVYGVGTRLITSEGSPSLGGVYKLVAAYNKLNGEWTPALKISDTPAKIPNPGNKQVWRGYDKRGLATLDLLGLDHENPWSEAHFIAHHPSDSSKYRVIKQSEIGSFEPLLVEVWKQGKLVNELPSLEEIRTQRIQDLQRLDAGVKRLLNPHVYHVSLTENLWELKQQLIKSMLTEQRL